MADVRDIKGREETPEQAMCGRAVRLAQVYEAIEQELEDLAGAKADSKARITNLEAEARKLRREILTGQGNLFR